MTEETKLRRVAQVVEGWEHKLKCFNHADNRHYARMRHLDVEVLSSCIEDIKRVLRK